MSNWIVYEQIAFVLFMHVLGFIFGYVAAHAKGGA
jgi:hypothetical protein